MALESSLVPIPSELVMIPAGYLAAQGSLDPLLATLAGGSGSLLGASAHYLFGRYAGRAFLLRYGKYFLIDERNYHEAEKLFLRNAHRATFLDRQRLVYGDSVAVGGAFGGRLIIKTKRET